MRAIDKLIDQLNLAGMAMLLANQSEVIEHTDTLLRLRVSHVHRHLVDPVYVRRLGQHLQERYGDHFQLIVEVDAQPGQTIH